MIKGIIFDFGGVFTYRMSLREFSKFYSQKNNLNYEDMKNLMITNWLKARTQEESEFFFDELKDFTNNNNIVQDLTDFCGFNDELLNFVKDNLYNKYKLGIISNHIKSWIEPQIDKYNFNEIFDDITTSYKAKSAKPSQEIFFHSLKNLNLSPEECIFIDDREDNILTANKLGFDTIFYKNFEQFELELRKKLK